MQSVNRDTQRLEDIFARLGVGSAAGEAAATSDKYRIGWSNPALEQLKRLPGPASPRQQKLLGALDCFYDDVQGSKTNVELGFEHRNPSLSLSTHHITTLRRRASFLLNTEALRSLPDSVRVVANDPSLPPTSAAKLEVNAILNSVKTQTERVLADAMQEAIRGGRVCPMVLQPVNFSVFLTVHAAAVENMFRICELPQPARDRALKPALEGFASRYFAYSVNYPGAPTIRPQEIKVTLNSPSQSHLSTDWRGRPRASIKIDSTHVEQFCRELTINPGQPDNPEDMVRMQLLTGFEEMPLNKKLAAFYIQSLLHELATVQELAGLQSISNRQDGPEAQSAAQRTLEEWQYQGSEAFGDGIQERSDGFSQREAMIDILRALRLMNAECARESGTPLITLPQVYSWANSSQMVIDTLALVEPKDRLILQVPGVTGQALLDMPEFKES